MPGSKYLIVGGGMAADAAVQGIREVDANGSITLVSEERDPPYDRPPLSKALWKGGSLDDIWRAGAPGLDLQLGRRVETLDPERKRAVDDQGVVYTFDKALLATGGSPRRFPFDAEGEVIYFRTVSDYRRLRERAEPGSRLAVIGGGFIGSEIAAALSLNGLEVVMIFPEANIGSRLFPKPLAEVVTASYRDRGVEVLAGASLLGIEQSRQRLLLKVQVAPGQERREIQVNGVVAGIGIEPNVQLARAAGLEVGNGIVVDELLRTTHANIYAAGDVAAFRSPALGERARVEHEDNANTMGKNAGRNMAGLDEPYRHLPFFYSDLFDMGYEAVGETDSRLETVEDWREPYREGVVHYLRDRRVRGVLLWNVWDKVEAARRLIAEPGPVRAGELKGRLTS
jgi:3-phenylpropionate/trans-cinnamate dioxygenase ferredoxin reductase subunit